MQRAPRTDKRVWFGAGAIGALFGWWAARRARGQELRGRVAVVTGATRGLGLRIATELAQAGCPLAICARERHEVKETGLRLAGYFGRIDILYASLAVLPGMRKRRRARSPRAWRRSWPARACAA